MLAALTGACRATGAAIEVSEAWRSPSPQIVARLREADVPLVAASDARYAAEVGNWQYLRRV
jgi:putative hydrolase